MIHAYNMTIGVKCITVDKFCCNWKNRNDEPNQYHFISERENINFHSKMTDEPSPAKKSRHDSDLYLVGREELQIIGDKLPSIRQVLAVFLHNTRKLRFDTKESADLVIDEVKVFWAKARIPTSRHDYCCKKLISLYKEYRELRNGSYSHKSSKHAEKEILFISKLDNLFDVASQDALSEIKGDARAFLISQRQEGRLGSLLHIDEKYTAKENKQSQRKEKEEERKRKSAKELKMQCKYK